MQCGNKVTTIQCQPTCFMFVSVRYYGVLRSHAASVAQSFRLFHDWDESAIQKKGAVKVVVGELWGLHFPSKCVPQVGKVVSYIGRVVEDREWEDAYLCSSNR